MSDLPLSGKRILVTRPRHQAGQLAEALEAQGAEVVRLATIEIIPPETYQHLDALLEDIEAFDWLIVTSANAAGVIADRLQFLQIPHSRLAHLSVAAVGPATATAISRMGLQVSAMPTDYIAEAVVAMLQDRVAGRRVLLVRAAVARDVIPSQLRHHGADIYVAEAYRNVIPPDSIDRMRELYEAGEGLPHAATFTSSSTVHNFFSLLSTAKLALPQGMQAISIGPVTSQALRSHQWEPAAQADPSDIQGLVKACVRAFTVPK